MPCEECKKPIDLHHDNRTAWEAWVLCDSTGRTEGGLRTEAIVAALSSLGGCEEDIERILTLERIYGDKNHKN